MATALTENKTDEYSNIYAEKLENIRKIRSNLESLITDLDEHDTKLTKGFKDI